VLGSQVVDELLHLPYLANWYFGALVALKFVCGLKTEAKWFPPLYWESSVDNNVGGCGHTVDADYWLLDQMDFLDVVDGIYLGDEVIVVCRT
jgi:hypothetical protein